jgi:hypothetical protein
MEDEMASKKVLQTAALAEKLRTWMYLRSVKSDPFLNNLIESLETGKNLHIWAELNPLEYLPHPAATSYLRKQSLVRVFTIIRNVLVFAPVALTWAAVSAATTAFAKYTEENANAVANFLDFWQNGYGYLASHWKIGHVAQLDFVIILIVIVLTLYVSLTSHQVEAARVLEEDKLDQERAALALEITLEIHDKKKITAVTMNQSLAGSISRLATSTKALEAAAKNIAKASRA